MIMLMNRLAYGLYHPCHLVTSNLIFQNFMKSYYVRTFWSFSYEILILLSNVLIRNFFSHFFKHFGMLKARLYIVILPKII